MFRSTLIATLVLASVLVVMLSVSHAVDDKPRDSELLQSLRAQLAQVQQHFGPNHPEVVAMQKRVAMLETAINDQRAAAGVDDLDDKDLRRTIARLDKENSLLRARIALLERRVALLEDPPPKIKLLK